MDERITNTARTLFVAASTFASGMAAQYWLAKWRRKKARKNGKNGKNGNGNGRNGNGRAKR